MTVVYSYRELIVWQRAVELAVSIYDLITLFPLEEKFGLTSQMRRSAISISSNIAEGRARGSKNDFVRFLRYAYASAAELESQLHIAQKLSHTKQCDYVTSISLLDETMRMLNTMMRSLSVSL